MMDINATETKIETTAGADLKATWDELVEAVKESLRAEITEIKRTLKNKK